MTTLLVTLASYILGCFSAAYYLFRFSTGDDIRAHGSGNPGARNIGRQLGPLAFVATFLIDCIKGTASVWLARYFELAETAVILAMLAVVAGHIWPAQLGFRGGKGVATVIGAILAFDYKLLIPSVLLLTVAALLMKNFTLAGLIALALLPLTAAFFGYGGPVLAGMFILTALIALAHRGNIREIISSTQVRVDKASKPIVERSQP